MVRHIVMWTLQEEALGHTAAENAQEMKVRLEALAGKVPGLVSIEVGINFLPGNYDVALVSVHDDREALAVYADHPDHVKVKGFIGQVVTGRVACDYEF